MTPDSSEIHRAWITASGEAESTGGPGTLFPYWSFTKTVIALCALRLAENGALDLGSRIEGAEYSLRQLLNHTAGLPDYGQLPEYHRAVARQDAPWSRDRILEAALARGHLFAPGEGWSYSNIGYMLAKERVEAAAGRDFSELVRDLVTRPLNLHSVEIAQSREDFARLLWPAAATYDPGWVYHGCLTGTAHDSAKLLHAVMTGAFLTPRSLAAMNEVHPVGGAIPGRPWISCGYGLGLMSGRMAGTGRAIGHSGAGPFCVNAVYHFPDHADPITVASFTNGTDESVPEHDCVATLRNGTKPAP